MNYETKLLQPYEVSRAVYRCESIERKLLYYAALLVQSVPKGEKYYGYVANFKIGEFLKCLGMSNRGGDIRRQIKEAVKTIATNTITLYEDEKHLDVMTWLRRGIYDEDNDNIVLIFSEDVGRLFVECKDKFSLIDPKVIGSLKSYYSMRYYEIALSYKGLKGHYGNDKNTWWFSYSLPELRTIFKVTGYTYTGGTQDFLKKIVQSPIQELNRFNQDFQISIQKIQDEKDRRKLASIKFICTQNQQTLAQRRTRTSTEVNEYSEYLAQGGDLMKLITPQA